MSQRGMAFAASRAERPLPVVENSGGGHDLNRYIPGEMRRVPGYTGHVPGRKIESSGIGMTYGASVVRKELLLQSLGIPLRWVRCDAVGERLDTEQSSRCTSTMMVFFALPRSSPRLPVFYNTTC